MRRMYGVRPSPVYKRLRIAPKRSPTSDTRLTINGAYDPSPLILLYPVRSRAKGRLRDGCDHDAHTHAIHVGDE